MTTLRLNAIAAGVLFVLALATPTSGSAVQASKGSRPNIYDESLDGGKQVADALVTAKRENKRVLVQFGANWCGWCHKLHRLFESDKDIAAELKADYVVLMVDVNKGHNQDLLNKYAAAQLGLPCLVVLDAAGKHLTTKDTAELEEGDHHSPAKVMTFLKEWAPRK